MICNIIPSSLAVLEAHNTFRNIPPLGLKRQFVPCVPWWMGSGHAQLLKLLASIWRELAPSKFLDRWMARLGVYLYNDLYIYNIFFDRLAITLDTYGFHYTNNMQNTTDKLMGNAANIWNQQTNQTYVPKLVQKQEVNTSEHQIFWRCEDTHIPHTDHHFKGFARSA